jgi:hypothetical protein
VRAAVILLLGAMPAAAQGTQPAPDYFVEAAMASSTASAIAASCPRLSIDPAAASRESADVLARLIEDGFEPRTLTETMADPSEAIATLQRAFLAKHALAEGADQDAVCDAGLVEIAEESRIGGLLVEVEQ